MLSENSPHDALPLCTTYRYISIEEVLEVAYLGPNPLITLITKNFGHLDFGH